MAINRYFRPTRYQGDFYTPPLELLAETLKGAQEQYNENYALASQIKNKYINALTPDRATANTIQSEWEGRIDNIVQKYSGDYSQATKDLNSLLSDMQREYSPGGKAHAIEYNYKTWTDHWKNVQEGVQKKTYTAQQAEALQRHFQKSYTGIGEKDPLTGAYTMANPTVLQPYVDEGPIVSELVQKVPKRTGKTVVPIPDGQGRFIMREQEYEYVDPNDMNNAIESTLINNDAWLNYQRQLADLQGIDPMEYVSGELQNITNNVTPLYSGVLKETNINKIEYDQIAMENLRHQHALSRQREQDNNAMKRMLLKHALENSDESGGEDLVQIGKRTAAAQYAPIDKSKGIQAGFNLAERALLRGVGVKGLNPTIQGSIDEVLSNPEAFRGSINIELLAAAKQSAEAWRDANGQPAKDKTALTYDIYNANLSESVGSGVFMRRFPDAKMMSKEAERLLPQLQAGTVTVHDFDTRTGTSKPVTSAPTRQDIFKNLYNTADNKPQQLALGRTSVQSGVPFGTVFAKPDGNGYYIVEETHEDIRRLNAPGGVFEQAFGFQNTPKRTKGGDLFNFYDNNQALTAYGKVDYLPLPSNPAVIIPKVRYYNTQNELYEVPIDLDLYAQDPNALLSDGKPNRRPMTPADMEQKLFPLEVQKRFEVRGAGKPEHTHFPDYLDE